MYCIWVRLLILVRFLSTLGISRWLLLLFCREKFGRMFWRDPVNDAIKERLDYVIFVIN